MKFFGKEALLALCLPAATLAAGYLNAWASLDACAEDAYREGRGRKGYDMRGRSLQLSRADVSARIVAPFVVEASYLLPRDLHGTGYSRTYLVVGGHLRLLGSDEVRYADTSPSPKTNIASSRMPPHAAASTRTRARWFDAYGVSISKPSPALNAAIQASVPTTAAKRLWNTTQNTRWISSPLAAPALFS